MPISHRLNVEVLESRTVPAASLVADINPGGASSPLASGAAVNGLLLFSASDGASGTELWKSDGTAAGTALVKDINPGAGSSQPKNLTNVNGTLFFSANDGNSYQLWKSDGTEAGTVLVKNINPTGGVAGSNPKYLTNVNGTLFFSANNGTVGAELWKSDGTTAGTVLVKDINPGNAPAALNYLTNIGGTLFFGANDGTRGTELWKSDGTAAGTVLVKDISPGAGNGFYAVAGSSNVANVNGVLFFTADDAQHGKELWKSDGTTAGTTLVSDIKQGAYGSYPRSLTNVGGLLFFSAVDATNGYELWSSNGTSTGTTLFKDIRPGANSSSPTALANVNGALFFSANDGANGAELWRSNGTPAGTTLFKDINAGNGSSSPRSLTFVNGNLFFVANNGATNFELWESNGTSAGTVANEIRPGGTGSDPTGLVNVDGKLFFSADDGTAGAELWSSAPPDKTGPRITDAGFSGSLPDTIDALVVTFDEPISPASFTASDVVLTGPSGTVIAATGVTLDAGTNGTRFSIAFTPQTARGVYTAKIGAGVLDLAGNAMDQNQNSTNGEAADQFTVQTRLAAAEVVPFFAVGGADGNVRILNQVTGLPLATVRPLDAGATQYTGLVSVALGDFNNDGVPDLAVASANPAGVAGLDEAKAGKVFVYDGIPLAKGTLTLLNTFTPFANHDGPDGNTGAYTNGLNIATGDVDGDGQVDLIAGTRGGSATAGQAEFGRLVVLEGISATIIGGIQTPFGSGYQKGVIVAAGNVDGIGGDEVAVTRGGPVASTNPAVQQIKVKVLQLKGTDLTELPLNADGSTAFAPFGTLPGAANAISRDGRVTFVDSDGDGKDELVFSALDPLTSTTNKQVRIGVYAINSTAVSGAAAIRSTGPDGGTYLTGDAVQDHAITAVTATGLQQNIALLTQSTVSGIATLNPLTGAELIGGFSLDIVAGGITVDGI